MPPVIHCNYEVAVVLRIPPSTPSEDDRLGELNSIASTINSKLTWSGLCRQNILGALGMTFDDLSRGRWFRSVNPNANTDIALTMIDVIGFDDKRDTDFAAALIRKRLNTITIQGDTTATLKVYRRMSSYRSLRTWVTDKIRENPNHAISVRQLVELHTQEFDESIGAMASRFNHMCIGTEEDILLGILQSDRDGWFLFTIHPHPTSNDQSPIVFRRDPRHMQLVPFRLDQTG